MYAAASHAVVTVEYTAPVTPVRASCQSAVKEPGTPGVAYSAVPVSHERTELAHWESKFWLLALQKAKPVVAAFARHAAQPSAPLTPPLPGTFGIEVTTAARATALAIVWQSVCDDAVITFVPTHVVAHANDGLTPGT